MNSLKVSDTGLNIAARTAFDFYNITQSLINTEELQNLPVEDKYSRLVAEDPKRSLQLLVVFSIIALSCGLIAHLSSTPSKLSDLLHIRKLTATVVAALGLLRTFNLLQYPRTLPELEVLSM